MKNIVLLEERHHYTENDLTVLFPGKTVVACDFAINDIEKHESVPGGYRSSSVMNIDHHAPTERMANRISSTNLAIAHVKVCGVVPADWPVVINHTDTDSILSASIVSGILQPDKVFGDAAIAADHTGEINPVADLLEQLMVFRDIDLSVRNLRLLLAEKPLEEIAQKRLEKRVADRLKAKQLVQAGSFKHTGQVTYVVLENKMDASLFPSLLPDATVILLFYRHKDNKNKWEVKFRIGNNVEKGFSLHKLGINAVDSVYGGRWNAGSNKRGGGTGLDPDRYVVDIAKLVDLYLSSSRAL